MYARGFSQLINTLAEASNTSPATVYRLSKTLMTYLKTERRVPA